MGIIDLVLRKEDIDRSALGDQIVVVFDVFLATTTISTVLEAGASSVITLKDAYEASKEVENYKEGTFTVAGELDGITIEGFDDPWPLSLRDRVHQKTVILTTSNGTVAIEKASQSKHLYASSIINNQAVANHIAKNHPKNITLICAGSDGVFSLEDFLGAGSFIDCYLQEIKADVELTDSALVAHSFYRKEKRDLKQAMAQSTVGKKLMEMELQDDFEFASRMNVCDVVPILKEDGFIQA